ncbi:MAG TPA: hypothetical protein VMS08_01480 [Candidatus Saccharimonadia bacterium]|nr:hypothetical protein [Candidatus Saccharimonadia bacterium]
MTHKSLRPSKLLGSITAGASIILSMIALLLFEHPLVALVPTLLSASLIASSIYNLLKARAGVLYYLVPLAALACIFATAILLSWAADPALP